MDTFRINWTQLRMIGPWGLGVLLLAIGGCQAKPSMVTSSALTAQPMPPLVMPSSATLNTLGNGGMIGAEAQVFNVRRDRDLGADLPPVIAPVNLSQVYIRDQQWILNGRPWENYRQTTRSLQWRSR